jgi:phytoene dehydrogenase-like protein
VSSELDALIVGAGPNGLTAAAALAAHGLRVHVVELAAEAGGGVRSAELTLPGFVHDVCSAVHTTGVFSPAFAALELERHGLQWLTPQASVAHPLDDGPAVLLEASLERTAESLGADARSYQRLLRPWVNAGPKLFRDILNPLSFPSHPWLMARLGWYGVRSASALVRRFEEPRTRALLGGCAAHSSLPLDHALTAALGLVFLVAGHLRPWPIARGGSRSIADALLACCKQRGVTLQLGERVERLSALPKARAVLFDLAPRNVAAIAADALPSSFRTRLERYRMGPGVCKVDWALDGPIPWRDPNCLRTATVHLGGRFEELAASEHAAFNGQVSERPFMIVAQQSLFDGSRAPEGKHTGYAYCHVPAGCDLDLTEVLEQQMERFAPGFRDQILARHTQTAAQLEQYNPSYIGGAITGGVADLRQFISRPTLRWDPYSTPNPKLFICSHSTPPGGGVHGMCGLGAAHSVLRRVFGRRPMTQSR